jgi:integrase
MFDARRARQLAAGDYETYQSAPGLRLSRSTVGWSWIYRYKSPADGRMRQVKLGEWPVLGWPAALVEWERQRQARASGADPAAARRQARQAARAAAAAAAATPVVPADSSTVGGLIEARIAAVQRMDRLKAKTVAEVARTLRVGVSAELRAMRPQDVSRAVAYAAIERVADRPVQASALRRELGAAWDWAHDSGRLSDDCPNWWRLVWRGQLASRGKVRGHHVVDGERLVGQHTTGAPDLRVLTTAEVGQLLRMLPHVSHTVAEILQLYLWTGCRGAEIVGIRGDELTEEDDGLWWTIPRARLKTGRHPLTTDLRVPLVGRARDIVLARRDAHGASWLYPPVNRSRTSVPHTQQKVIGVAVYAHSARCTTYTDWQRPRWPMPDWAPHDLRRTVRTVLAELGCPSEIAEAVLGHMPTGIVGVYNRHRYDRERREWLTRLAEHWEAAARR